MKKSKILVFLILVGLTIPSLCLHIKQEPSAIGEKSVFLQDSYNYFVTKSGNKVWAGALTLAWHEFNDNILKENIRLKSQDEVVKKIVENYNTCPFKRVDLSQSDYYIKSGYGQKTVTQINTEVKKKFPKRSFADIDETLGDKDIISYAYLAKQFEYPFKFKVNDNFQFKNSSVKSFRASTQDQRDQVNYLYYENKNQFLVKLKTKKDNEGVYLLRTDYKEARIQDIINQVNKWENQNQQTIASRDYFEMPVVDFDYQRDVPEVLNIALLNQNFENYIFSKVYEGLKLKIDESGVKVENEGVMIAKVTSVYMQKPIEPKYFILDDTFWIILKEQGKHPYLCIKVNNPREKQSL